MEHEFERIGRRTPYPEVSAEQIVSLERRCREAVAHRRDAGPADMPRRRTALLSAAVAGMAAAIAVGCFLLAAPKERETPTTGECEIDRLLSTMSSETIQSLAATNYDDIVFSQIL